MAPSKLRGSKDVYSGLAAIFLKNNPLTPFFKGESEGFPTSGNDRIRNIFIPMQSIGEFIS